MSGVLALSLLMAAAATPTPPVEDEITVVARKMRLMRVSIKATEVHGRLVLEHCRISRSSGDAELDAVPCEATQACMTTRPTSNKALAVCVDERSQVRLDEIVARRRAARSGES